MIAGSWRDVDPVPADEVAGLAFAADIIRQKVIASIATLESQFEPSRARDIAIDKTKIGIDRLSRDTFTEYQCRVCNRVGMCVGLFAAWNRMLISWTGTGRRLVPIGWQTYTGRSSLATGVKLENRNASQPVNAPLNYAYAVKLANADTDHR